MSPERGEQGHVFVEALIAAAIVSMMVGAMFHSVQGIASRARAVDERRQALLIAQSELAAAGVSLNGSASGAEGAFGWRVETAPYQQGLERVTVRVGKAGRTLISLSTLRLSR